MKTIQKEHTHKFRNVQILTLIYILILCLLCACNKDSGVNATKKANSNPSTTAHTQKTTASVETTESKPIIPDPATKGDIVIFGNYPWFVLSTYDDGSCVLLAKGPVTAMPFNDGSGEDTWDKSSLRKWLNNEFYMSFTEEERALIVPTEYYATNNLWSGASGGKNTCDNIYLLDYYRCTSLSNSILICDTDWWLRSPGESSGRPNKVSANGYISELNSRGADESIGVRPAITLKSTPPKATPDDIANTQKEAIKSASVGDVVQFGDYSWTITKKYKNTYTLFCCVSLPKRPYSEKTQDLTWENSTLRKWLNETFYSEFSDGCRELIIKTHNQNPDHAGAIGGNDTEDYIYLYSLEEIQELDESLRKCAASYWLRSPGLNQCDAAVVGGSGGMMIENGKIYSGGQNASKDCGVRPVLQINIEGTGKNDFLDMPTTTENPASEDKATTEENSTPITTSEK